ncbi:hypothetical protein BGZ76_002101 [Entomortierella beljakovae]|nr:hypothetical protein BGZ76_002101 [Entomortierella beljakovae]
MSVISDQTPTKITEYLAAALIDTDMALVFGKVSEAQVLAYVHVETGIQELIDTDSTTTTTSTQSQSPTVTSGPDPDPEPFSAGAIIGIVIGAIVIIGLSITLLIRRKKWIKFRNLEVENELIPSMPAENAPSKNNNTGGISDEAAEGTMMKMELFRGNPAHPGGVGSPVPIPGAPQEYAHGQNFFHFQESSGNIYSDRGPECGHETLSRGDGDGDNLKVIPRPMGGTRGTGWTVDPREVQQQQQQGIVEVNGHYTESQARIEPIQSEIGNIERSEDQNYNSAETVVVISPHDDDDDDDDVKVEST